MYDVLLLQVQLTKLKAPGEVEGVSPFAQTKLLPVILNVTEVWSITVEGVTEVIAGAAAAAVPATLKSPHRRDIKTIAR